jgi:glycosyltransferase involved in cell wall biosynthesis
MTMRLLFAKHALAFPRSSGHDVHTFHMMKACASIGHEVALATVDEPGEGALDGLTLAKRFSLGGPSLPSTNGFHSTYLQRKFRSFWGVEDAQVSALRRATKEFQPAAVIVAGLDALPYFPGLEGVVRVWYAADEWVLHHASLLRPSVSSVREHVRAGAVKGLYERAHRRVIERVWVVSDTDQTAMRWLAGMRHVDVLPNGVDADYFKPGTDVPQPRTAAFWGRLDFAPNIDAVRWFCGEVWPQVRSQVPDARFTIVGFNPAPEVRELARADGVSLQPDVRDLRDLVRRHSVAVMPFVSGAGIKNKLLEAAAMGLPIVSTPLAMRGLRDGAPLIAARSPQGFAQALINLWSDPARQHEVGAQTRAWVIKAHDWTVSARDAVAAIEQSMQEGPR